MIDLIFDLKKYIDDPEKIDKRKKSKLKYFLLYLKEACGEDIFFNVGFFALLNKQDLLDSLEFFISETFCAKNTAEDYMRAVIELCELISHEYGIKNELFGNAVVRTKREDFDIAVKARIKRLKERQSRQCISDEDYANIQKAIEEFFHQDALDEKIRNSIINITAKPNYFAQLVSAIALMLVIYLGLDNNRIANLETKDLDIENKTLELNGIKVPLDSELASVFQLYLTHRSFLCQISSIQTEFLFVKKDGSPYLDVNGQADNSNLFFLMENAVGHKRVSSLRRRTLMLLALKGVNINLLMDITGVKETTMKNVYSDIREDLVAGFSILGRGDGDSNQWKKRRMSRENGNLGEMRCPYCGKYKDACSDNWILIQTEGDDRKYISCKECGGGNGEYKY